MYLLNEYEICLKMLEMAISETHINFSKISGGACPQTPQKACAFGAPCAPSSFESPGPARNTTSPAILQPWHLCNC